VLKSKGGDQKEHMVPLTRSIVTAGVTKQCSGAPAINS